jgi:hypothetical protein
MSIITDWRVRDEADLPDLQPGEEYECVIAPQKFIVLHRIIVRGQSLVRLTLVHVQIGTVPDVPFKLDSVDGEVRRYLLTNLDQESLKTLLIKTGAAVAGESAIAIVPGLEVRLQLRNEGNAPIKPRAALLVQEESS